ITHVTFTSLSSALISGSSSPKVYHVSPDYLSWNDALTYCRTHHKDLALIESAGENTAAANVSDGDKWIGLFRSTGKWSDNRAVAYTAWYHELSGKKTYHEPCVHLYGSIWRTSSCGIRKAVCYSGEDLVFVAYK
uniref:C-type lectin domain-containing protein n=1 Tax=Neogobius melanostomus TaxID=47308 RepID=A0A8C6S695_9GOBI